MRGTTAYSLLSIINPVIENQSKNINVLDFGVLAVLIIFILEVLLIRKLNLIESLLKTPTMVKFAKELETDELSFLIILTMPGIVSPYY